MYAISAAPNIVLPLCSGAAVQRYGARGVLLITMGLVCGGQAYLAVAVQARSPVNMIVGRLMYGSGTEVLGVLTADLISQCFL
jgi:MFS family permease